MEVIESGGKFVVDDVGREQVSTGRAGELSVTGPMFGVKMLTPSGEPAERETRLLNDSRLKLDDFAKFAQLLSGAPVRTPFDRKTHFRPDRSRDEI